MAAIDAQDPDRRIAFVTPSLSSTRLSALEGDADRLWRTFIEARKFAWKVFGKPGFAPLTEGDIKNSIKTQTEHAATLRQKQSR